MRFFNSALSNQLLRAILVIYFAITLLVTLVHVIIEYNYTRNHIHSELVMTAQTFNSSLETALWDMNKEQLRSITEGMSKIPLIYGIIITDPEQRILSDYMAPELEEKSLDKLTLSYNFSIHHTFNGNPIKLADVTIYSHEQVIFDRLKVGFSMLLLNAIIKSTALILLFTLAFKRHLGEPLFQLTHQIETIIAWEHSKKRNINVPFEEENELTQLQLRFNELLDNITEEEKKRFALINGINEKLENEVKRRTYELEQAKRELEHYASVDALTNIFNRRIFFETAEKYFQLSQRQSRPLSFIMLDIDYFKQVNDLYGHQVGDKLLQQFVQTVQSQIRTSDIFGRIGGEEFGIVLENSTVEQADMVALKIKDAVEHMPFSYKDESITITTSIGVTQKSTDDINLSQLYKRADDALYAAKHGGRNTIKRS